MKNAKDITGSVFGRLTVIKKIVDSNSKGKRGISWLCRCSCGNDKIVKSYNLQSEHTRSCGCLRTGSQLKDYTGEKFGKISVIRYEGLDKFKKSKYLCRCDCGNEKILTVAHLVSGAVQSCGCYAKDCHYLGYKEISGSYFSRTKTRAKDRNQEFSITIEYLWELFLKQDRKCALSGIEISFSKNWKTRHSSTASLDRIDSLKGYIEGNVQWVHKDVNFMKQDLSENKFIDYCEKIYKFKKK